MFEIINKQILAKDIKMMEVYAPNIARKFKPGQFISVCPEEGDERIPLTIIDSDWDKGLISMIFQERGETTRKLGGMPIREPIFSILGPLGMPARIEKIGTVICIATGIGTAQILPICRAFKSAGNKVIGIVGAKTKKALMLEAQMRLSCNKFFIATNDGSYERRGFATDILETLINKYESEGVDTRSFLVYAIGAVEMMQSVCSLTREKKIKMLVQLTPVMGDCMGMCGSCRVKVGGETVSACTEGPEFDGHKVDFEDFSIRMNAFEESKECCNHRLGHNRNQNEPGILRKFLSDILKK